MSTLLGRLLLVATGAAAAAVGTAPSVLPNGWALPALHPDPVVQTGTMPQGAAISSDGSTLAVLESGFNPPALALYATPSMRLLKRISLTGALGKPVWTDRGILVAGANADALFVADPQSGQVRKIALPQKQLSDRGCGSKRNGRGGNRRRRRRPHRQARRAARSARRSRRNSARQSRVFKRRHEALRDGALVELRRRSGRAHQNGAAHFHRSPSE